MGDEIRPTIGKTVRKYVPNRRIVQTAFSFSYYMNYLTKMTSWEDPRIRNKSQGTPQHYPVDFVAQQVKICVFRPVWKFVNILSLFLFLFFIISYSLLFIHIFFGGDCLYGNNVLIDFMLTICFIFSSPLVALTRALSFLRG